MLDLDTIEHWWEVDENDPTRVASLVFETVKKLHTQQSGRHTQNLKMMRLYGNMQYTGTTPYSYAMPQNFGLTDDRLKYNVVCSVVDTVWNKMAKAKPKMTFLTTGGNWTQQKRAEDLDKFVYGQFYESDTYGVAQQAFKDAEVFDNGFVKNYREGDRIYSERVFPSEIYVDEVDAMYGKPSHMYQVKYVLKDVLFEKYGRQMDKADREKLKLQLKSASGTLEPYLSDRTQTDHAVVIEAWHLKSGPKAEDGRHVICIDGVRFCDDEWDKDYFPFATFRWSDRLLGYWGQSLAERLVPYQVEINKLLRVIQQAHHLLFSPKIFVEPGFKIVKNHLSNEIGTIIEALGKPEIWAPNIIPPRIYSHLKWLIQSAYAEAGVSELSAQSRKPAGLDHAVAIREFQDIESERFVIIGQRWEKFHMEIAEQYIDLAKEIGGDYKVRSGQKKFFESISWKDVDMERDEYIMQIFPTSLLPSTPSARIQKVMELAEAGWFPKEVAMSLVDFPDIQAYSDLINAPVDIIKDMLEAIVERGEAVEPEPYMNLPLTLQMSQYRYLKAKLDDVEEERLELLRRFIEATKDLMNMESAATPPADGMPAPDQGAPAAGPAPGGMPPAA